LLPQRGKSTVDSPEPLFLERHPLSHHHLVFSHRHHVLGRCPGRALLTFSEVSPSFNFTARLDLGQTPFCVNDTVVCPVDVSSYRQSVVGCPLRSFSFVLWFFSRVRPSRALTFYELKGALPNIWPVPRDGALEGSRGSLRGARLRCPRRTFTHPTEEILSMLH